MATIPYDDWTPQLPASIGNVKCVHIEGQGEIGEGGFQHWQLVISFKGSVRLSYAKRHLCGTAHLEPTRSDAARTYVWKESTRIAGTQFEFGQLATRSNSSIDWEEIWQKAKAGSFEDIPANIRVRSYANLRRIRADFMEPAEMVRNCDIFWGRTGTGKSRRAWTESGLDAYPKGPSTKFWDGYRDQQHVVIDEFRGEIGINHFLRWLDRYPVSVEVKGSAIPLSATKFWITSNVDPKQWWPLLDEETYAAFRRRVNITHFH